MNKHLFLLRLAHTAIAASLLTATGWAQAPNGISKDALQQIDSIVELKKTFSPAEQKMSSNLVFRSRAAAGKDIGAASKLIDNANAKPATMVDVDLSARVSSGLLQSISSNGGVVKASSEKYGRVSATIPLSAIPIIAAHPDVRWIRESLPPMTNVGALTSQGYIAHKADKVGSVTGSGVKVGVISDSASAAQVAALITSGDLGATTTVISGQNGSGSDEGAAMMETVQDIAPGAQLFFATGNPSQTAFATNLAALAAAGCSIIVDDVTYFDEGAFQDDAAAQAVTTFVNDGGIYFSSAANSGNQDSGTSGTWEGDFLDGGAVSGPIASAGETGRFHNFGTAGSPQNYNLLTATTGNPQRVTLKWSDPLGGSTNDYDLFVLNNAGTTLKAFSAGVQNGTQDPYEMISYTTASVNDRIVVILFAGTTSALRLDTHRGQLSINTVGSTFGHNAGTDTIGVAAAYWNQAGDGTHSFIASNGIENFSSDGPRRLFYNANGTAITPGNVLFGTNGGVVLQQPILTAADGGVCKTPGFLPFYGTSAAAPHAAGIAALVKSAKPSLTNTQVRSIMTGTALDIMSAGTDRDSGFGITLAKPAVDAANGP